MAYSRGLNETARFHHSAWHGGYVASLRPSAATDEDETGRFRHSGGKISDITASGRPFFRAFFEELSRLGYVEGQNLGVERYSGEGRTERYAELARDVVNTNPDLILALGAHLSLDFKMATTTIPMYVGHRSDCPGTCGEHRAAGRQHHRYYYRRRIGNHWKTYRAAGRGTATARSSILPPTILGRCTR